MNSYSINSSIMKDSVSIRNYLQLKVTLAMGHPLNILMETINKANKIKYRKMTLNHRKKMNRHLMTNLLMK